MGSDPVFSPNVHAKKYTVPAPHPTNELLIAAILDAGHGLLFLFEFLFVSHALSYTWPLHVVVCVVAMGFAGHAMCKFDRKWDNHKKEMKKWIKTNYVHPTSSTITSRKVGRWDARIDIGVYFLVSLIVLSKYDNPFDIFICILSHLVTHAAHMAMVEMYERFRTNKNAAIEVIADHYISNGEITYATMPKKDYDRVIYISTHHERNNQRKCN